MLVVRLGKSCHNAYDVYDVPDVESFGDTERSMRDCPLLYIFSVGFSIHQKEF